MIQTISRWVCVARPRHPGPDDLDQVLATLPDNFTVRTVGAARFVLGPTGAHVVAVDDGSEDAPCPRPHASLVRDALADRVTWVPFVHAMLVTERTDLLPGDPVPRLMPGALVDGPTTLDDPARRRLVDTLADGVLDRVSTIPAGGHPLSA